MFKKLLAVMIIAFLMIAMPVSATEIRGSVAKTGDHTATWTADNFAAFFFDVNNDNFVGEKLEIKDIEGTSIPENHLVYTTTGNKVPNHDGFTYTVVGWMGEKYVAIDDRANKIAKLVYDMADDEKITLTSADVVNLGSGYTLAVNEVDAKASPRQAWIKFSKDGVLLDDGIVGMGDDYEYRTTVLNEEDVVVFHIKITSIFSGTNADMLQLKYGWLIDQDSAKEIQVGDSFGSMEVTEANPEHVILKNDNSISLNGDSQVTFMGNMKFKVSKEGGKFYPKIDIVDNVATILPTVTATPTPVETPTLVESIPVVTSPPVEDTVVNTVTPTPEPVVCPKVDTPVSNDGYSLTTVIGLFIVGILAAVGYGKVKQRGT